MKAARAVVAATPDMTTLHAHALARQPGFRAATFRLRAHAVTGMRDDLPGISRHRIGADEKAAPMPRLEPSSVKPSAKRKRQQGHTGADGAKAK